MYEGECIGGPLDGQWVASQSTTYPVDTLVMQTPLRASADLADQPLQVLTSEYRWISSERRFRYWEPHRRTVKDGGA